MKDIHMFPGGKVEEEDLAAAAEFSELNSFAGARFITDESRAESMAYVFTAIRETAEETGLLFARNRGANSLADADLAQQIFNGLLKGADFYPLIRRHDLVLAPEFLRPFSWWITPEIEQRRYDTRFFLVEAPQGQLASCNEQELAGALWMEASEAVKHYAQKQIRLAPPTLASIEQLEKKLALGLDIRAICPQAHQSLAGELILALPGDKLFKGGISGALPHRTRFFLNGEGIFI